MRKALIFLAILWSISNVFAQVPTIRKAYQQAGKLKVLVTNMGMLGSFWGGVPTIHCEYPAGSNHDYFDVLELVLGGVINGDTCVSAGWAFGTTPWHELFPSDSAWDTIWVASMTEPERELPPWIDMIPRNFPLSEQDFLCHYSDKAVLPHMTIHTPMGIDVYQLSYSWGYPIVADIIFFEFYIKNTGNDTINDFWVGFHCHLQAGNLNNVTGASPWERRDKLLPDDCTWYDQETRTAVYEDTPGGEDGDMRSVVGWSILDATDLADKEFTFRVAIDWDYAVEEPPGRENEWAYKIMTRAEIEPKSESRAKVANVQSILAFGPYTFRPGETIVVGAALVGGEDESHLIRNAKIAHEYYTVRNLAFSPAPPPPSVTVIPGNHKITLKWSSTPEFVEDTLRWDGILNDFEGYRIYKSTKGIDGPYTLLAEFDKVNWYGYNTGLQHEYTDSGLVNGVCYYYAVTSYDLPDTVEGTGPKESGILASAVEAMPGTPPDTTGERRVAVVPNPYHVDVDYTEGLAWEVPKYAPMAGWTERDRRIQFINLPPKCTIRIYTLGGELVKTIEHDDPLRGWEDWNLISRVNQTIGTGIYIFSVEDHATGNVQVGKFVIIK